MSRNHDNAASGSSLSARISAGMLCLLHVARKAIYQLGANYIARSSYNH